MLPGMGGVFTIQEQPGVMSKSYVNQNSNVPMTAPLAMLCGALVQGYINGPQTILLYI